MAKTKIVDKNALSQYTEEMKGYIKSQGLGLTEEDINGLIDIKLVPVNETIEDKVDKVDGMGLSTNDYTDIDKEKVDSIPSDAKFTDTVYDDTELSDRVSEIESDYLTNSDKTELASAIDTAKQEVITTVLGETVDADFDTLQEVAEWIQADTTNSAELITRVTNVEGDIQLIESDLSSHKLDTATHVTSTEKTTWNTVTNKVDKVSGKGLSTNDYTNEDKTQVATNKTNILLLKDEVESLQNDIKSSTDTTLYNSKKGGYRLTDLVGNTEQKTMSGKNLFGGIDLANAIVSGFSGVIDKTAKTVTFAADKTFVTVDGKRVYTKLVEGIFKENTQYTFILRGRNTGGTDTVATNLLIKYTDESYTQMQFTKANEVSDTVIVSDAGKTIASLRGNWNSNSTILYYEECGIFEGVITLEDFEKYCGGTPSPNPSFPQAIENTFDCVEMRQGHYIYNTGVYENNSLRVCNKNSIPCKSGDKIGLGMENADQIVVVYYTDSGYLNFETSADKNHEFVAPSGATKFNFNFFKSGGLTVDTVGKITLTVNGKYVGQIVEHGKNLWNEKWEVGALNYKTGENYATTNSIRSKGYNTVEPNTEYYINNNVVSIYEYRSDMSYIKNTVTPNTFTTTVDTKYIRLEFTSGYGSVYKNDVCITKEPDDTYAPYTEKVVTFFLNEPLRATDRVVKVDGVFNEEHKRATVAIKDLINTSVGTSGSNNRYSIKLPKKSYDGFSGAENSMSLCTHFKYDSSTYYDSVNNIGFAIHENYLYLRFGKDSEINTRDLFIEWVNNNNPIVEYPLAEETYTPLDTTSQLALNDMETFDGVTYIEVDSKIPPTSISGEYGTTTNSSYTLKLLNEKDNDILKTNILSTLITTTQIDALFA